MTEYQVSINHTYDQLNKTAEKKITKISKDTNCKDIIVCDKSCQFIFDSIFDAEKFATTARKIAGKKAWLIDSAIKMEL